MVRRVVAFVLGTALVAPHLHAQDGQTVPQSGAKVVAPGEASGRVTRVRDVLGLEVLSEDGESYGTVEDLTLDKKTGQIEYVVIAPNKDSQELYPLPWQSLTLYQGDKQDDQYLILGMKREQFTKAPTITRTQWPAMTTTQWSAYVPRVTTYYGEVRQVPPRVIRRTERAIRRAVD